MDDAELRTLLLSLFGEGGTEIWLKTYSVNLFGVPAELIRDGFGRTVLEHARSLAGGE